MLCFLGRDLESDFHVQAFSFIENHVKSIVNDLKRSAEELPRFYSDQFKVFYQFGCQADHKLPQSKSLFTTFQKSWGAREHILFHRFKASKSNEWEWESV